MNFFFTLTILSAKRSNDQSEELKVYNLQFKSLNFCDHAFLSKHSRRVQSFDWFVFSFIVISAGYLNSERSLIQPQIRKISKRGQMIRKFCWESFQKIQEFSKSVTPMVQSLGWDSLHHPRLLSQGTMFCKINMGHVGISLPPDAILNERRSRAPNCCPFREVKVYNDIYKYSFYPRTIALWNNKTLSFTNIDNWDTFKSNALSFIRSD